MAEQKTVVEYADQNKRFRAEMNQSIRYFGADDIDQALECILDVLGNTGLNVLDAVKDMLIAKAMSRNAMQKEAADCLGISTRMLWHNLRMRNALDAAKQYRDDVRRIVAARVEQFGEQKEEEK